MQKKINTQWDCVGFDVFLATVSGGMWQSQRPMGMVYGGPEYFRWHDDQQAHNQPPRPIAMAYGGPEYFQEQQPAPVLPIERQPQHQPGCFNCCYNDNNK